MLEKKRKKKCTWEAKRPSRRESSAKKLKPGSLKGSKAKGLENKKRVLNNHPKNKRNTRHNFEFLNWYNRRWWWWWWWQNLN